MTGGQSNPKRGELVLSPSRINTFERCQLQFKYRYLENKIKPPAAAAAIGIATHKAIEANLASKLNNGALLPLEAIQQTARDAVENEWTAGVQIDADDPMDKGAAIDESVALATVHHEQVAPGIEPVAVEEPFGVKAGRGVKLTGHIDVLEADAVRDSKTIGQTPSAMKRDHYNQAQLYAVGVLVNKGALPKQIKVDYLVKLKREKKALTLVAPVTEESAQLALDRLSVTARVIKQAIKTGDFLPAPADGWACNEKWCGYWGECPFGAAKRILA